jgi:hypothetical protein
VAIHFAFRWLSRWAVRRTWRPVTLSFSWGDPGESGFAVSPGCGDVGAGLAGDTGDVCSVLFTGAARSLAVLCGTARLVGGLAAQVRDLPFRMEGSVGCGIGAKAASKLALYRGP